jgi:hypothetical protein
VTIMSEIDDQRWREELDLKKRDLALREREVDHKIEEGRKASRWGWLASAQGLAFIAAAIAFASNALVAYINGKSQRELEEFKAESALIFEAIKTNDPDKAAVNLKFMAETGQIAGERAAKIGRYLDERKPGQGASLQFANAGSSEPGLDPRMCRLPLQVPSSEILRAVSKVSDPAVRITISQTNSGGFIGDLSTKDEGLVAYIQYTRHSKDASFIASDIRNVRVEGDMNSTRNKDIFTAHRLLGEYKQQVCLFSRTLADR